MQDRSKVLNFILDIGIENFKGNLSKKKYMSIADTASTTASRDIANYWILGVLSRLRERLGEILVIKLFFNSTRRHSYLGYISPNEFEKNIMIK